MISFECDYNNGAHPEVLKKIFENNEKQSLTYGFDEWTNSAKTKIRKLCNAPEAQVYFLAGGTQTNMTVIDGMLQSYEAVISVESGHINVHEAGAVEFTGHKVITLPAHDGKMNAKELDQYMDWFIHDESTEHLAQPGLVYITFPTEYGTIYSAEEIANIHHICQKYRLGLFIDGARLGYGLMSRKSDIDFDFLAHHCDVFYIGGTKVGALFGEAVVFPRGNAPKHFFTTIKQHGALLAKGRAIGIQFDALLSKYHVDGEFDTYAPTLYQQIAKHAIDYAERMKKIFIEKGYQLFIDSPTNQQFVIIPNDKVKELEKKVIFTHWEPYGKDSFVCRFVTSWATTEQQMQYLEKIL